MVEGGSLYGTYRCGVDDKGRLVLAAVVRRALAGRHLVLAKGPEGCLMCYDRRRWERVMEQTGRMGADDPERARIIRRMLRASAHGVEMDPQGRILLPPELRRYCGVRREAVVLGQRTYAEIWAPERWTAYQRKAEPIYRKTVEQLLEE